MENKKRVIIYITSTILILSIALMLVELPTNKKKDYQLNIDIESNDNITNPINYSDVITKDREEYNNNKNSHATVIKRIWDIVGDNKIYQFGIRSGTKEEFDFSLKENHTYMEVGNINTFKDIVDKLEYKKIYITIDLDVFDPSIFPGTGTPEPGGVTYREFENIFSILKNSNVDIVGCDIVELSPDYDNTKVSTVLACKVLRELALVLGYNNEKNKNK